MSSNVQALARVRPLRTLRDGLSEPMSKLRFGQLFDGPATIRNVMV